MTKPLTITGRWNAKRKCIDVDPIFWDDCGPIGDGTEVVSVVTTDRHPEQLRWYWSALGAICKSGAFDGDKDQLDDHLRIAVGFGKWRPIAAETSVHEPAWEAAWQMWSALGQSVTGPVRIALRKAIESYAAASPQRAIFIPDSIAMSKCDGRRFKRFVFFCERYLAEKWGIDTGALFKEAESEAGPLEQKRRAA